MIYIGSSICGASNSDELVAAVAAVRDGLARAADSLSVAYHTIGIAIDSAEEGYEHLARLGAFDEIVAGSRWTNLGALRYVWQVLPGRASTPQVIATIRDWSGDPNEPLTDRSIKFERLLVRMIGSREIRRWATDGAPLPFLPTAPVEAPS
jgi:hypothetical protein